MEIRKFLAHPSNYSIGRSSEIKYIVIHYTANNGDTANGNCNYFSSANRYASAHYFVDENKIVQSVLDENTAWSVGANIYKHSYCRNSNSISIEMCSRKDSYGNYYIKPETVNNTIKLTKYLMEKYNIPVKNVLRHYDVTGKMCPKPFVVDESLWTNFKNNLVGNREGIEGMRYKNISEVPSWSKDFISGLINEGSIADKDNVDLTDDMIRTMVIMERHINKSKGD